METKDFFTDYQFERQRAERYKALIADLLDVIPNRIGVKKYEDLRKRVFKVLDENTPASRTACYYQECRAIGECQGHAEVKPTTAERLVGSDK
jgi:hypothetical protein